MDVRQKLPGGISTQSPENVYFELQICTIIVDLELKLYLFVVVAFQRKGQEYTLTLFIPGFVGSFQTGGGGGGGGGGFRPPP